MRYIFLLSIVCFTFTSSAANFYVDANTTLSTQNGTLANPWKTLSQVQNNMNQFAPGDFISFKRGCTFPGQLEIKKSGTVGRPITFNTYGSGAAPIFSGTGGTVWYLIFISGRSYVTIDGINITDPTLSQTDRSQLAKIQRAFYLELGSNNMVMKNCSVSLVGIGVFLESSNNTIDSCTMQNLRMVVNSPGGYDDYGANPILLGSSNNRITNNKFLDNWAPSYDYTYDGGAIECFGSSVNNNFIGYNTIVNNCGLIEVASDAGGTANGNVFAYNKLINNGSIFFIHNNTVNVSNFQFYNNVIIETIVQRVYDSNIAGLAQSSSTSGMIVMKNNIFWLTTGIDVTRGQLSGSQMIHEDNIYKLGTNSVLNFSRNSSELITSSNNIFNNTTPADPSSWNLTPLTTSPAIDFGQNVGMAKDFAGNPVPSVPNAGLFENAGAPGPSLTVTATYNPISCNGALTTVTVNATGGTAPYTGTGSFPVSAGSYTYNITDAAGNSGSKAITITQPAALTATVSAQAILIFGGLTTINVSASGGTAPYTYKLTNGSYQSATSFPNIGAGDYIITIKDANNCTISKNLTISQPGSTPLTASAMAGSISCNGGSTTVNVTASGGTAPYTGTGTFNATAGTKNYVVTDAVGNTKNVSVLISQPAAIVITLSAPQIQAQAGKTTITVTTTGGTGIKEYKRNNGNYRTSNVFKRVAAGTHVITVKDANGCTVSKTIVIASFSKQNNLQAIPEVDNVEHTVTSSEPEDTNPEVLSNNSATSSAVLGKNNLSIEFPAFKAEAFPNPTTSFIKLRIQNPSTEKTYVSVLNLQGKTVETAVATGTQLLTLAQKLSAGIYILKVQNGKEVQSIKIVKTN